MKKSLVVLTTSLLMMTLGCTKATAQSEDFYTRAGASVNYFWGEDDGKTKNRLSPAFNITIGKWFNYCWAIQIEGNLGKVKGAGIGLTPYNNGSKVENIQGDGSKYGVYQENFNFATITPEIVYNVSNGMCGYNGKRVWNVLAHIGPGYGVSWANGESAGSICGVAGITSTWNVCRYVQVWLDGKLTVFGKNFDKQTYRNDQDCMGSITAGISFTLGK